MDEPNPELDASKLVRVFTSGSLPEAELAKGLLESAGIPVLMKGEGEGVYKTGAVYLWVFEQDEAAARELLAEAASGTLAAETDSADGSTG
jgi:hypothetical protein